MGPGVIAGINNRGNLLEEQIVSDINSYYSYTERYNYPSLIHNISDSILSNHTISDMTHYGKNHIKRPLVFESRSAFNQRLGQ